MILSLAALAGLAMMSGAWPHLVRRVRMRLMGRVSAWLCFSVVAFGPLLLGTLALASLTALEGVTSRALVPERAVFLLIPATALGVLGSAAFALRLALLRTRPRTT